MEDYELTSSKIHPYHAAEIIRARDQHEQFLWVSRQNETSNSSFRHLDNRIHVLLYRELLFVPLSTNTCWTLLSHIVGSLQLETPLRDGLKGSRQGWSKPCWIS